MTNSGRQARKRIKISKIYAVHVLKHCAGASARFPNPGFFRWPSASSAENNDGRKPSAPSRHAHSPGLGCVGIPV